MNEIWKDIAGYEGVYKISSLGMVSSSKYGKTRLLKAGITGNGYLFVILSVRGKPTIKKIARLVANAFIKNQNNKPNVNHKNGIKTDNRIENLEWCTQSENIKHAYSTFLKTTTENNIFKNNHPNKGKFGKLNHRSKSILQYDLQGKFIKEWGGAREIERELGIPNQSISGVCRGERKTSGGYIWCYLSSNKCNESIAIVK